MPTKVGEVRLALRREGDLWNAYLAHTDTMEGAGLIGSLSMGSAQNPLRREQFMQLMKDCLADAVERATGERPQWDEVTSNEHPEDD